MMINVVCSAVKFVLALSPSLEIVLLQCSLDTQSCITRLLLVLDFWVFLVIWAAGLVLKKELGADYEQFLRVVFSWFQGHFFFVFFENIVAICSENEQLVLDI